MLKRRLRTITQMATTHSKKQIAPYGEWPSPITTDLVLSSAISLGEVKTSPAGSAVAWIESRPEQKGRSAIVYQVLAAHGGQGGQQEEVIPDTAYNARSRCVVSTGLARLWTRD